MKKVEVPTTLNLHEKVTIPMIFRNCESRILTKTDEISLERMDLWCLKRILSLPRTTPSAAVRFINGNSLRKGESGHVTTVSPAKDSAQRRGKLDSKDALPIGRVGARLDRDDKRKAAGL